MFSKKILLKINKFFPLPIHPFNLNNQDEKSYAMWQYEKGQDTIAFFINYASAREMFYQKDVLDAACGAAGKSLYYASLGAKKVTGLEILEKYEKEALDLAKQLGLSSVFEFVAGDAAKMPFKDCSFDTIIANDALEHVDKPFETLKECLRVLKPNGRLFVNFPPYYHPFGAHLSDAIGVPWAHIFFSDATLIEAYKELVRDLPDGQERIAFRFSEKNGREYMSYINKITLKRFKRILKELPNPAYYREVPLRSFFAPLCVIPGIKEMFVKMAVCVFQKEAN